MKFSREVIETVAGVYDSEYRQWASAQAHQPTEGVDLASLKIEMPPEDTMRMVPQFGDFLKSIDSTRQNVSDVLQLMEALNEFKQSVREKICLHKESSLTESLLSRVEDLILFLYTCSTATSLTQVLIPAIKYIKTWCPDKFLLGTFIEMVTNILTKDSSGEDVHMKSEGGFFGENWDLLTTGPFGKRFAGCLNLLIMIGFLPEKAHNLIDNELYKVFHVQSMRKNNPSIFHHLFHTIDWVVDSVWPAISKKDLSLLLYDSDYNDIDVMYRSALDMVQLSSIGEMEQVKRKYGISNEAEVIVYVIQATAAMEAVRSKAPQGSPLRKEMFSRILKLDKVHGDLQACWKEKGLREQPYGILIRGPSSVGKSVLAGVCAHTICKKMGFPEGPEFWCTINGSDKYQSDYKSQHICVIFDDMGNPRPERCLENPLFILIQFINNMHCSALSPEADKKGKMDIRSKIVIVTTNTSDLHASYFSINPASILRRFELVIDAKLKPECATANGSIKREFAGIPMPNIWDLRLGTVKIHRSTSDNLADSWSIQNVMVTDVIGLVEYLVEEVPGYYANQEKIVDASTSLHLKEHCEHHPAFVLPCPKCAVEDGFQPIQKQNEAFIPLSKQSGRISKAPSWHRERPTSFLGDWFRLEDMVEPDALAEPDEETNLTVFERINHLCGSSVACCKDLVREAKKTIDKDPLLVAVGTVATVGLAALTLHKIFSPTPMRGEGAVLSRINELSKVPKNFVERDNAYPRAYSNSVPFPKASVSSTLEQMETKVDKNLNVAYIQEWDEANRTRIGDTYWCNTFPVGGKRWQFVGHQFKRGKTYLVYFRVHPSQGIKRFKAIIDPSNADFDEDNDRVTVEIDAGGDNYDFSKYMVDDIASLELKAGDPIFIYHAHRSLVEGDPEKYHPPSSYKMASKISGIGPEYIKDLRRTFNLLTYQGDNHEGMCGSMVFLASRHPVLIGFHSAGCEETQKCGATLIDRSMLRPCSGITFTETSELPEVIFGKRLDVQPAVHPFSPLHYMDPEIDHNLEVYGQHALPTSKFKSDIVESPMLESMKDVLNYEPTHTSPSRKGTKPSRRRHFEGVTAEPEPINPTIMKRAKDDFKRKIKKRVISSPKFRESVHTLSYDVAINGVPGVKGIDCLNPKSSMGFTLNCPKFKAMLQNKLNEAGLSQYKIMHTEVDDNGNISVTYKMEFDPEIADVENHVEEVLQCWLQGERCNLPFRTFFKDEPVTFKKVADNKIRIVAAAPVTIVIIARMLTLPLITLMSLFPEEFESAVGVNATGKDWDYIANHMFPFGRERCGHGDYAKFDVNAHPEFTGGGWELLRFIMEECEMPDFILKLFDGLATECMFPIYEVEGLLFKAFKSNPSGHPLTVIINGLANALYMRYAYYSLHFGEDETPDFDSRVKLMTYGDDNFFNVSPDEDKFNMRSVSLELAKIGISYTDAHKQVPTTPFAHFDELSFLKRNFNFHSTFKAYVGALEKDSIFKSLACSRRPAKGQVESMAQICAGNLASALRELYMHSPVEYYHHLPLFHQIASRSVDDEGFKVIDFYKPPSEQDIINSYDRTHCAYLDARLALSSQSGEIPRDAMIFDDTANDQYMPDASLRFVPDEMDLQEMYMEIMCDKIELSGLYMFEWAYHHIVDELFRIEAEYSHQEIDDTVVLLFDVHDFELVYENQMITLAPPKNKRQILAQFFARTDGQLPILVPDYRDATFCSAILQRVAEKFCRHVVRRSIARQIDYMWEHCMGPHIAPSVEAEAAYAICRRAKRRRLAIDLPSDLVNYIYSFQEGPLFPLLLGDIQLAITPSLPMEHLGEHLGPWLSPSIHSELVATYNLATIDDDDDRMLPQ